MAANFRLGEDDLTTAKLYALAAKPNPPVTVTATARTRLERFRELVTTMAGSGETYYGINTGFGLLSDIKIAPKDLDQLQINFVRSHACGVGDPAPDEYVRALLLLKLHGFYLGHSGISAETADQMHGLLKHDILPIVPCQGSVGASGDLAPLAHIALGLLGEGDVRYQGRTLPAHQALEAAGLKPPRLKAKEGLSLANGTQFMGVLGAFATERARHLARSADVVAALSLNALRGTLRAFDARIHQVRNQTGQIKVAANVRSLFEKPDSIMQSHLACGKVQDPYSFRCLAQVHGASRDAIEYAAGIIDRDLNAVTDNPLVFEEGDIISGGNFHGQPLALSMDFIGIAVAELGSISERRIEKLTNPHMSGLPPFITQNSGLNSGFMIPHVVAAALVSENKILSHPASVDSIPTSADKEDHVSMGPIAGRKALDICRNVSRVLAIEILAACQGIDLLAPLVPNETLGVVYEEVRRVSPKANEDKSLHKDIEALAQWILDDGPAQALARAGCLIS